MVARSTQDLLKASFEQTGFRATTNALAKTGDGNLHTITISLQAAAAVAGVLTIYDNTAKSGTVIYSEYVHTNEQTHTVILDVAVANGIYIGYDATLANVAVVVTFS